MIDILKSESFKEVKLSGIYNGSENTTFSYPRAEIDDTFILI
jgi:hypothetical protein